MALPLILSAKQDRRAVFQPTQWRVDGPIPLPTQKPPRAGGIEHSQLGRQSMAAALFAGQKRQLAAIGAVARRVKVPLWVMQHGSYAAALHVYFR